MKQYRGFAKNEFLTALSYREHFLTSIFTTVVFYVVLYFLWKAIFAGSETGVIQGMTFAQTYVNLALATCLFRELGSGIEWDMHFNVQSGDIIMQLIKPVDYQGQLYWGVLGNVLTNLVIYIIPTFVIIMLLFPGVIFFGWNVLIFILCCVLTFNMMFFLSFIAGTFAFYAESVWGISWVKDLIVSFFAGVSVPLQFFPDWLKRISDVLPFHSMISDPIRILLSETMEVSEYAKIVGFQFSWMVVLFVISRFLYGKMQKRLVVNGG